MNKVSTIKMAVLLAVCTLAGVNNAMALNSCPYDTTGDYSYDPTAQPNYIFYGDGQITYDGSRPWYLDDLSACFNTFSNPGYLPYFPKCDNNGDGQVSIGEVYDIYYRVHPVGQGDSIAQKACVEAFAGGPFFFCPPSRYNRTVNDISAIVANYPATEAIFSASNGGLGHVSEGIFFDQLDCATPGSFPDGLFESLNDCYLAQETRTANGSEVSLLFAAALDISIAAQEYSDAAQQYGGVCTPAEGWTWNEPAPGFHYYKYNDAGWWFWNVRATKNCSSGICVCDNAYQFWTHNDYPGQVWLGSETKHNSGCWDLRFIDCNDPSDGDGDGAPACVDECDDDPQKTAPGACGCGIPDEDANEDGNLDCFDPCYPGLDSDGDGVCDADDPCVDDPEDMCLTGAPHCPDTGCGGIDTDTLEPDPPGLPPLENEYFEGVSTGGEPSADEFDVVSGTFRVSESGAATYSYPIATAPGSGGLVPQISLEYSSQGSNGLIGQGWSLSGLSAISRCRRTTETYGYNEDLRFHPSGTWLTPQSARKHGAYCLDGQSLLSVSGTYGEVNSTYHKELDDLTEVTLLELNGDQPTCFMVTDKSGSTRYYGNCVAQTAVDASAAIHELNDAENGYVPSGKYFSWQLSRVQDSAGNYLDYYYNNTLSTGELLLDRVEYTGNVRASQVPYAELRFHYEPRADTRTTYFAGSRQQLLKRLARIESTSEGVEQRRYQLSYSAPSEQEPSRLEHISECRYDAGLGRPICLPPVRFEWLQTTGGLEYAEYTDLPVDCISSQTGDINGDGRGDVLCEHNIDSDHVGFRVFLGEPNQTLRVIPGDAFRRSSNHAGAHGMMDYNGDGRLDIIYRDSYYNTWMWYVALGQSDGSFAYNNPTSLQNIHSSTLSLSDFNGDGLTDILYHTDYSDSPVISLLGKPVAGGHQCNLNGYAEPYCFGPATVVQVNWESHTFIIPPRFYPRSSRVVDLNGDARADLIAKVKIGQEDFGLHALISGVNSGGEVFFQEDLEYSSLLQELTTDESTFYPVDLNGDNLTDILYTSRDCDQWDECFFYVNYNSGSGFLGEIYSNYVYRTNTKLQAGQLQFIDENDDGLIDIYFPEDGISDGWESYYLIRQGADNTWKNWIPIDTNIFLDSSSQFLTADLNGDGFSELLKIQAGTWQRAHYYGRRQPLPNSIAAFENSVGMRTEIAYRPLTNPDVYVRGDGASELQFGADSAVFDLLVPIQVVSKARSSAPAAGTDPGLVDIESMLEVQYRYEGLRFQAGGRGSLGFEKLITVDPQQNIETITSYRQDFPYVGIPYRTAQYNANNNPANLLNESINSLDAITTYMGGRFPYNMAVEERAWDLGGELINHTITSTGYDIYLNAQTVTTEEGGIKRTEVTNNYGGGFYDLYYGRLRSSTTRVDRNDALMYERTAAFEYDPDTNLLIAEIAEPDSTDLLTENLKTVYFRDSFGNVIHKTQCSNNVANCGATAAYTELQGYGFNRWGISDYDPRGRLVQATRNINGEQLSAVLARNDLYQPTEVVDQSGVVTSYVYDFLGRQTAVSSQSGTYKAITPPERCVDVGCPLSEAVYRQVTQVGGAPSSFAYFDILGREVAKVVDGYRPATYFVTKTEYDARSQVVRQTLPHMQGSLSYWVENTYDLLGRIVQVEKPDGEIETIVRNGLSTTFFNALSQEKTEEKNLLGELISTSDDLGNVVDYYAVANGDGTGWLDKVTMVGPSGTSRGNRSDFQTIVRYDRLGRKVAVWDADKTPGPFGTTGSFYHYNALGELLYSENARGYSTQTYRDNLGRQRRTVERNDSGTALSDSSYTYEPGDGTGSSGRLLGVRDDISGYAEAYYYDIYGRPEQTCYEVDGLSECATSSYDSFGRPSTNRDVTGGGLEYIYELNGQDSGYLTAVRNADDPGEVFQQILDVDAFGNVTAEQAGNGVRTDRTYDPQTGKIVTINSAGPSGNLQDLVYDWDAIGNLNYRFDSSRGRDLAEHFIYDDLNRLTTASAVGPTTDTLLDVRYDRHGNITYKSDVSQSAGFDQDIFYGQSCNGIKPGPHAVSSTPAGSYCYDEGGNVVSGGGRQLTYDTAFELPTEMVADSGSHKTNFAYSPGHSRYKRVDYRPEEGATTTHYFGNVERTAKPDGSIVWKRHIPNATIKVAENVRIQYEHKDHLGSSGVITNAVGIVLAEHSFDAFGKQRSPDDWTGYWTFFEQPSAAMTPLSPRSNFSSRGFTGHEHIDELGLVHMNGRVYDPHLGRFLQADPIVQEPSNGQNLNRYSYVLNNPLAYTDPSGFSALGSIGDFIHKYWKPIVAIAICVAAPYAAPLLVGALGPAAFVATGAAAGFISGYVMTGSLRGAVLGALSGAAFGGLHNIQAVTTAMKIGKGLAHGFAGGVSSVMQGGKFGHGFLSAGISQSFELAGVYDALGVSTASGFGNRVKNAVVSAVLGGSTSALSGGKFANGAVTAAYSRLLNDTFYLKIDGHGAAVVGAQASVGVAVDTKLVLARLKDMAAEIGAVEGLEGGVTVGWTREDISEMAPESLTVGLQGKFEVCGQSAGVRVAFDATDLTQVTISTSAGPATLTYDRNGLLSVELSVGIGQSAGASGFAQHSTVDKSNWLRDTYDAMAKQAQKLVNPRMWEKIFGAR